MEIIPDPLHALLLVLPFAFTAFVVNLVLWKPLLAYLDERDHTSHQALTDAHELEHQVEETTGRVEARLLEARAQVTSARAQARARAQAHEAEVVAEARRAAEQRVTVAVEQIDRDRSAASAALNASAQELSNQIAGRILGRPVA